MNEYRQYIRDLAKAGSNTVFFNSGPDHAAMVMGAIFENADKCVKIYAGGFTGEVSTKAEYKNGLEKFLRKKGTKLEILLQQDKLSNEEPPKIFDVLRYFYITNPDQISIKKHPFKVVNAGQEIHFTVADDKMYRMEEDVEKFTARGNFNDPDFSIKMSEIFDQIYNDQAAVEVKL